MAPALMLARHGGSLEVFHIGIKVIDLLAPLVKGSKAAMFGGAGVGKAALIMELIRTAVERPLGHLRVRREVAGGGQGRKPAHEDRAVGSGCGQVCSLIGAPFFTSQAHPIYVKTSGPAAGIPSSRDRP